MQSMDPLAIIRKKISETGSDLKRLAKDIHDSPEIGYQENKACAWQIELLKKHGFEVETPCAGMPTAYLARKGKGKPAVLFPAEYDALPEIGHACGHNLIAPASIGAGIALAECIQRLSLQGTVIVAGTPAEEGGGGKLKFISAKKFDDAQLAVMGHPDFTDATWNGFLAVARYDVTFFGKASHAAAAPEEGINALDAVVLLFQGLNAWRQHIPEDSRIHGIVTEGGVAPNIVPERAACRFFLRASNMKTFMKMEDRFRDAVKGASLMTGARAKINKTKDSYKAGLVIEALNDEYLKIAAEMGMAPSKIAKLGRGSSDFGDLSQTMPGIHYYFKAVNDETHIHMREFAEKSALPFALESMLKAAETSARIGLKFISDKEFRRSVGDEFEKKRQNDEI